MKISCIGAGNVAWHLTQALEKKGHQILEIYSRQPEHAQVLAQVLTHAGAINTLDFRESKAELILLAVSDDALESVLRSLKVSPQIILAHTSGSKPLEVFKHLKNPCGVFYPLQTFSKNKTVDFSEIPCCIEASDLGTQGFLIQLASELSRKVYSVNSEQRKNLHLAAVMACNFSNHLMAIAQQILEDQQLEFAMLKALIRETFEKALMYPPKSVQTGPARRGDLEILNIHQDMLLEYPNYRMIYEILSQSILEMYS